MASVETFNKNFFKIIDAIANYAEPRLKEEPAETFYLSFDVPGRSHYDKVFLTFEPDRGDRPQKLWSLYANVPAQWNSEYMIRQKLFGGGAEGILQYLRRADTEAEFKLVIEQLDESGGHEHPHDR